MRPRIRKDLLISVEKPSTIAAPASAAGMMLELRMKARVAAWASSGSNQSGTTDTSFTRVLIESGRWSGNREGSPSAAAMSEWTSSGAWFAARSSTTRSAKGSPSAVWRMYSSANRASTERAASYPGMKLDGIFIRTSNLGARDSRPAGRCFGRGGAAVYRGCAQVVSREDEVPGIATDAGDNLNMPGRPVRTVSRPRPTRVAAASSTHGLSASSAYTRIAVRRVRTWA